MPRLSSLRQSVEQAPLPAACAGLLLLALLLQLGLPVPVTLLDAAVVPLHGVRLGAVSAAPVGIPPAILAEPIFSPARRAGAESAGTGALTLAGTAGSRRGALAIVRDGSGREVMLRPGESFAGWRLLGVGVNSATFDTPGGRQAIRIGEPAEDSGSSVGGDEGGDQP